MHTPWTRLGTTLAALLAAVGILAGCADPGADPPAEGPGSVGQTPVAADQHPPEGMRYDYFRNVRITVPDGWAYDSEPGSDWCVGDGALLPDLPYVSLGGARNWMDIGCPPTNGDGDGFSDEPPAELWTTHLALTDEALADAHPGTEQVDGWWVVRDRVGDVGVKAVSKDRAEAEQLVASAVVVEQTPGGCTPHGAVQNGIFPRPDPAFDVTQVADVEEIVVCQYAMLGHGEAAGLAGTATIDGPAADAVLAAIQAAPVGGGPDRPHTCVEDQPGDDAYELRLRTGDGQDHVMFVFYSTCRGNGFDDGTTKRMLTAAACQPLMEPPVQIWGGSSHSFQRCYRDDAR